MFVILVLRLNTSYHNAVILNTGYKQKKSKILCKKDPASSKKDEAGSRANRLYVPLIQQNIKDGGTDNGPGKTKPAGAVAQLEHP
jgi:hypothetical protein